MKNFRVLSKEQMSLTKGGGDVTPMEWGEDEGGTYVIVDTGSSCQKIYYTLKSFIPQ